MGLGQMLLRLLLRRARHVHQDVDDDVVLYLLANQTKNKDAWKWYKKRGFHVLEKRPSFSPNMVAAFHNHVDPAIKKYLKSKSSLQWLSKKLDVTTDYELKKVLILQGMFVNPYALWKPNAYAMLPSHVSLHELDKCMPTSKVKAIKHLFALPKQTIANYTIPVGYSHTVYVTWVSRTFQLSGKTTFDVDMLDLCIAWSQRHNASTSLIGHIFIIPTYVMSQVYIMYLRHCSYLQSKMLGVPISNDFDEMEFMESVPIVLKFLYEKVMFLKATYIGCLLQDMDDAWSCLIHVNDANDGATDKSLCFYRCDPTKPSRNKELPTQWQFFLKLASMVQARFVTSTAYADAERMEFKMFRSMENFDKMMQKNYDYFNHDLLPFAKQIPKQYSDEKFCCESAKEVSDVKALMFLLDFLRCLEDSKDRSSNAFIRKMGTELSTIKSQRQMMTVVVEMQRCIIELMDKLSETQLGERRRTCKEYQHRIRGLEKLPPDKDSIYGDQVSGQWLGFRTRFLKTMLTSQVAPESVASLKKDESAVLTSKVPAESVASLKKDDSAALTSKVPAESVASLKKDDSAALTSKVPAESVASLKKDDSASNHPALCGLNSDTSDEDSIANFPQKLKDKKRLQSLSKAKPKKNDANEKKKKPKKVSDHEKDQILIDVIFQHADIINDNMEMERIETENKNKHELDDTEQNQTNQKPEESDKIEAVDVADDTDIRKERKRKRTDRKSEPNRRQQRKCDMECWEWTDIAPVASFFKNEYRSLTSEGERRNIERKIFWILQSRETIASIEGMMNDIQEALLPEKSDIAEIPDAITDEKCPENLMIFENTKPPLYRTITEKFKDEYVAVRDDSDLRKEVVEKIGVSLHSYGFRFFAGMPGDKPAKRMELNKILTMIDWRMKRVCKTKEITERDKEKNDGNEDNNDDVKGPFTENGQPSDKCIIAGQRGKKRTANLFFQEQLHDNVDTYSDLVLAHEKIKIRIDIRNKVRDRGYFFVTQDKTGVWKQDTDKEVNEKIRQAFRHLCNPRKRIKVEEDDDAIAPLTDDGRPTSKAIIPGGHTRKGNAYFRSCLMDQLQAYKEAKSAQELCEIRNEVKLVIAQAGYFFLERDKETNAWSVLQDSYVTKKIRSSFTFLLNPKRKGKEGGTKMEEEKGMETEVRNDERKNCMVVVASQDENVEHGNLRGNEVSTQIVSDEVSTGEARKLSETNKKC